MSEIQNISVNISLATLPLSQKGFGMPLIVGTTNPSTVDLEGAINNASGYSGGETTIDVDGFSDSLNPIASGDVFTITGETGSPTHTVVSTTTDGSGNTITITFTTAIAGVVADDAVITVIKESQDVYYEITDADDLLDTSIGYQSSDPEYKMAQAIFSQSPRMDKVAVVSIDSFANLAARIAELRNQGKDAWYYLLITSRAKADIAIADTYVNSLEKIGFFASSDQTITSSGERTVILISNHADEYPEAAWLGRVGALTIGSATWDSKQLNGQKNSGVTLSEQSTLLANNLNLIREMGGVNVSWEGKTMSGQYIDVIQGRDLLKARLTEGWHSLKINTEKIPFTEQGRSMVESYIREVFRVVGRNGVIAPVETEADNENSDMGDFQYQLSIPEISEISTANKAARVFAPITFKAIIAGGINSLEISGTLTV